MDIVTYIPVHFVVTLNGRRQVKKNITTVPEIVWLVFLPPSYFLPLSSFCHLLPASFLLSLPSQVNSTYIHSTTRLVLALHLPLLLGLPSMITICLLPLVIAAASPLSGGWTTAPVVLPGEGVAFQTMELAIGSIMKDIF